VATSSSPSPKAPPHGDEDIASPFQFHIPGRGGDVHVALSKSPSHGDEDIASPFQFHTPDRGGDVLVAVPKPFPMEAVSRYARFRHGMAGGIVKFVEV
jgi:hypothetical protein